MREIVKYIWWMFPMGVGFRIGDDENGRGFRAESASKGRICRKVRFFVDLTVKV